jgi:proteasome accessory factor C
MGRPDTATRARRLLALLPLLKRGETIAIAELASAVGATPEETAADLATLTMCGVPPFTPFDMIDLSIEGDFVTVYIEPPAIDKPVRLTAREARALAAALEAAGYAAGEPLVKRLLASASTSVSTEEIEHTVRAGEAPEGVAAIYTVLARAVEEHTKVSLHYLTGTTGRQSMRVVHPWALVNRRGLWYLIAFCEEALEERVFRLDHVRAAEPLGEAFDPPGRVSLDVQPDVSSLPAADVRFDPGVSVDMRDWPGATFAEQPDGSLQAEVPYRSPSWVARRVAAYLGSAEVLSPPEVRDAVVGIARTLLGELG